MLVSVWAVFGQFSYWDYRFDIDSHLGYGGDIIELNGNYYWGVSGISYQASCKTGYYGLLKLGFTGPLLFETITIDSAFCDYQEPIPSIYQSPSIETFQNNQILCLTNKKRPDTLPYNHITSDLLFTKYDTMGNTTWSQVLQDSGYSETPYDLVKDDEGYFIVADKSVDFGSDDFAILHRTDESGNVIWSTETNRSARSGIRTADSGYLIVGGLHTRLTKLDSMGNEEWNLSAIGSPIFHDIIRLSDENYLISGVQHGIARLIKIDAYGNEIWSTNGLNYQSVLNESVELADGSIVSTGQYIEITGSNPETQTADYYGWLVKTDPHGNVLWERKYINNSYFYHVQPTSDGGFLLSGVSGFFQGADQDAWLVKVDSTGYSPNFMVGINETEKSGVFNVWPNPCVDVLNLDISVSQAPLQLTVADVTGREIWNSSTLSPSRTSGYSIDVSLWPSGVYILNSFEERGRSFSAKVLKQ